MADLLDTLRSSGVDDLLSGDLSDKLRALGVTIDSDTTNGDVRVVRGTVLPLSDRGLPQLGTLPLQAPGLSSGLRFQLAVRRPGGGPVDEWALDLDLDRVTLLVPDLRPARERREPARATRLEAEPNRSDVRVVGRGVLRVAAQSDDTPTVSMIDRLDDTDPFGPRGPVATLGFEPPSFFLGSSEFGFTVDELTYDQSGSLSPAPKPPEWRGLALRRATLYLPPGAPLLGDISLGVQDVFLGDPVGVEGTATLEFGGAADTPLALVVEQETVPGTWTALAVTSIAEPATRQDRVTAALQGSQPPAARVRARLTTTPTGTVTWRLPGGTSDPDGFDAMPGDTLEVRLDDAAPTVCAFTGTWATEPTITLALAGGTWTNATSLSGRATDLASAVFCHAATPGGPYAWAWDDQPEASTSTTGLPTDAATGTHELELRTAGRAVRRVRVDVRQAGAIVLVGCRAGAFEADGTPTGSVVTIADVSGTYPLSAWHAGARLDRGLPTATATGGAVTVGEGLIAEVVTDATVTGTPPPAPTTDPVATRAHVRFVYDSEELQPADALWEGDQQKTLARLRPWVESLGATAGFAVVGRCDDLSGTVPLTATTDPRNANLAGLRARATRDLLTAAGVPEARIAVRGEQSSWSGAAPTGTRPTEAPSVAWLARSTPDYQAWNRPHPRDDDRRRHLRRGDIYAYDVAPTPDATPPAGDTATLSPVRLRALVPGADPTTVTGAVVPATPRGRPQYRVRIEVEWNDPTARGLGDAVPIRAEALVQWPGDAVRMPGGGTAPVSRPDDPTPTTPPVWTLRGRWAHDRTAGSDQFTLTLDVAGSRTGIAQVESRVLAASLGLAPAVVGAASSPTGEGGGLVGALITALGAAASLLLRDGSKTVVTGLSIDHLERGPSGPGSRTRLTVDYTVELSVDVSGSGLPLRVSTRPDKPMRLRYRGVGVEVDTAAADWWDGVGLIVRESVPEVVDPGSWQLGPPLDDLLRVTGVRSGAQSSWLEVDLALSLDLGVVKLSNATVRVVFGPSGIDGLELRGLRAGVDIPATIKGEGALDVSAGTIHAGLALDIIPLKVAAVADLTMGTGGFVEVSIGVRFPAPIPFANSGLGLFGVLGRFVSNGERNVDRAETDVVVRELGWLARPNPKYRAEPGQYALGLGAVVGTVPDLGFTFHALGMVTVEFPRPAVVFAVIAQVIVEPAPVPRDQATAPASGLSIVGLVLIDEDAVTIALRGSYRIPGVLELDVPLGAWFPYATPTHSYLRIGTDGQPGRAGTPVTMTFLPGTLDVRVTAFLMVQGNGLSPGLRGHADFVFQGFSIGYGAGWGIDWSAGPIRLSASAEVLAGFGTAPFFLAAGVWVRGELDLVVVSVAARGEITLRTDGNRTDLHGEFCGEVDCFFFSISGCVEINISATLGSVPPPPSPVAGVDLVARLGHASAKAVTSGTPPTAWPDTIPVIHFAHTVENGVTGGVFEVGTPMPGPVWSGSRDVKHAYRITEVTLEPVSGPPLTPPSGTKFSTAWWWPGVRSSSLPPWLSAAESEPRDLALLTWEPWTGLLPLTEPDGSPGDPGPLVGGVCDPVGRPEPVCVVGGLGIGGGPGRAVLPEDPGAVFVARSRAQLRLEQPGDRPWSVLLAVAATYGVAVQPGRVAPLELPTDLATGDTRKDGWRLASLVRGGQELGALGASGAYTQALSRPNLVLEVCPVPVRDAEQPPLDGVGGCVGFDPLDPELLREHLDRHGLLHWQGLVVGGAAGQELQSVDFDGDGRWGLLLTSQGLVVDLEEPQAEVTLRARLHQEWKAVAFSGGEAVAEAHDPEGRPLTLRDLRSGRLIVRVEVFADEEGALVAVCDPAQDPAGETGAVFAWRPGRERLEPPDVYGVRADGSEEPWEPKVVRGRKCSTVVSPAPDDETYAGVRVAAAPGRRVSVVGSCGILWHQELEVRQAEEHRTDVLDALTLHATGPAGTVRGTVTAPSGTTGGLLLPVVLLGPPPRTLLRPGTEYRVSVTWQWQRWERSGVSTPGSPDPDAWQAGGSDVYRFRTAALAAPATPPPPVELIAEDTFDPRGLARYVTGARPDGPMPHLLDDPVRITLSVDYLATLLDGYGFDARVDVRPTDVDPGTVPPGAHPPDKVTGLKLLAWVADHVLRPAESRVVDVLTTSPCAPPTSLGGTAVEVLADLEPATAYDLLLVADPRGSGPGSVVQRWHFRTSRYHDVAEILRELGLPPGDPSAVAPGDILLDRAWPALTPRPHDDRGFDAALSALGIDPWPMPASPRTTTLWVSPTPSRPDWALAAVLLEAPEPIARSGRVTVSGLVGGAPLAVVAGTSSGTRVLLAPAAGPVVPTPTDAVTVILADGLRGITASGGAFLLGGPRTIRREVSS